MTAFLGAGVLLGLSAGFSPGPLFALVLSQTLRYGVREGIKVAAAPLLTDLPIILASTFLLSRFSGYKELLGALSIAGAAILAHMAFETFRAKMREAWEVSVAKVEPRSLMKGALVNFFSPHPYLFWIAIGSPMILKGWEVGPAASALFVAGFSGCLVAAKVVLAVLTGRSSRLLAGKWYVCTMRALGCLLFLFAGFLLWDGFRLLGWI